LFFSELFKDYSNKKRERLLSFPSVEGTGFFSRHFLDDLTLLAGVNNAYILE
jgi:hypothetical protein